MFSSRLIKRDENPLYQIETFHGEDLGGGREEIPPTEESHHVTLPVRSGTSASPGSLIESGNGGPGSEGKEVSQDRLAAVEREAYEKGFEQGRKDGLALERRQMDEKGKQLATLFSSLEGLKGQIYREAKADLVKLGLTLAKMVIRGEVRTQKGIIGRTVEAALKLTADKSRLRIRVNPEDMEEVKRLLPDLALMTRGGRFEILEDPCIQQGGCFMETGFGNVNATIDGQLAALERELQETLEGGEEVSP